MNRALTCSLLVVFLFVSTLQPINAAQMKIRSNATESPLKSTLNLLYGMWKTGLENFKQEKLDMIAADGVCKDNIDTLTRSNSRDKDEVDKQKAIKGSAESLIAHLEEGIGALNVKADMTQQEIDAGKEKRDQDAQENAETIGELTASKTALVSAIGAMEAVKDDIAANSSFIQVMSSNKISEKNKALVDSFMSMADAKLGRTTPEAVGYKAQTFIVLETLNKLLAKFEDEKAEAEKEELDNKFIWEKLHMKYQQRISEYNAAKETKNEELSAERVKHSEAAGALEIASSSLSEGTENLKNMVMNCNNENAQYKRNQLMREDEIALIKKTIEVLGEVGNVEPPNWSEQTERWDDLLVEANSAASLIQVSRSGTASNAEQLLRQKVVNFLMDRSEKLKSQPLSLLMSRMQRDPIQVAKRLIKDLMMKMVAEANVDDGEKVYCDRELNSNALSRNKAQQEVETKISEVEAEQDNVLEAANQITILSGTMESQEKELHSAEMLRKKEERDNKRTELDAQDSQAALFRAIEMMKEFYASGDDYHSGSFGGSTVLAQTESQTESQTGEPAFIQTDEQSDDSNALTQAMEARTKEDPVMPNFNEEQGVAAYGGQDKGMKVINLLDHILTDYAKLESDTQRLEAQAKADHEVWLTSHGVDMAITRKEYEHQVRSKEQHEEKVRARKKDLHNAQRILNEALRVYEEIKPMCEEKQDWTHRIIGRNEEIEACQEALNMLSTDYSLN